MDQDHLMQWRADRSTTKAADTVRHHLAMTPTKTDGQRLYEHENPAMIRVIPVGRRAFATEADVLTVRNPAEPTPWRFLTARCQQQWEDRAIGHNLFSAEEQAAQHARRT